MNGFNIQNLNIPTVLIIFLLMNLIGCSSIYHPPESIDDKMNRYQAKKEDTLTSLPKFKYLNYNFKQSHKSVQITRDPANKEQFDQYSNRRLYLMILLHQYNQLKTIVNNSFPDIKSCPAFHTTYLETNEWPKNPLISLKKYQQHASMPLDENTARLNPELYLPLSYDNSPDVILTKAQKVPKNLTKYIGQGLSLHLKKIYHELTQLCENGRGTGQYLYSNLVTHMKNHPTFRESMEAFKTVMKIPVFTNHLLIISLMEGKNSSNKSITLDLYNQAYSVMIKRLNANWISGYFQNLLKKRNDLFSRR